MQTSASVAVKVYFPETEEGKRELAGRVAEVHAEFVIHTISELNCPAKQKNELLQAIVRESKKMDRQQKT